MGVRHSETALPAVEPLNAGMVAACPPHWGRDWKSSGWGTRGLKRGTRAMDETKWFRWLRAATRETTIRGIARAAGVSHTTVRKWIAQGVPPDRAWDIAVRFRTDPIELLVLFGRIEPGQVPDLNYAAIAQYVPTFVLTEELHRRAETTRREYPHIKLQKRHVSP